MGSKYTTTATSGYNSSPPSDDGSQTAGNLITWAKHKTKLSDPVKDMGDSINTKLVAAFDYAVRQITTSDALVAGDHMRTVEIAPSATTGVTVTLADAATMTNIYRVWVKNSSAHQQTIARATGGDTIDGTAGNITIPSKAAYCLTTNNAASGYLIVGCYPLEITNLTEDTAPATSDLIPTYDISATSLKKVRLAALHNNIPIGNSTSAGTSSLVANINSTAVGNVGGGTDDLMTYSLPANSLSSNGKAIRVTAWGTTANNVNAKTVGFAFGAAVTTASLRTSILGVWRYRILIIRTGSNTQDFFIEISESNGAMAGQQEAFLVTTATETDSGAITVKCTGAGTSNNDIVQEGMLVEFLN